MMNKKSIAVIALSGLIGIGCLAGCNKDSVPADRQKITFWGIVDQYNGNSFKEMVEAYNKGQGAIDGVWVSYLPKSDTSSDHVNTCTSKKPTVDVIGVSDRYTFNNIAQGFYTNLQPYVDDTSTYTTDKNGKKLFDVNNYASNNIDRYRFNVQTKEAGKGEDLYMLPMLNNATVLYYNETQFINNNINIISVPEEELDAYNATNGTSYAPRGYAEYTVAASPATNLKTSVNLQGQTVVKVFNNCIPMSFLETNTLSKYFSKAQNTKSSTKYGILNEWWFSHGWAVGGDCVKWDEDANQYKFTLGEEAKNYLVTSKVTINGVLYQPGEILTYRDKKTVQGGAEHLYELPSQYEQFREFCAWSQKKGVAVDDELSGYEISPSPETLGNTSKATYFTSSEVAMLVEDLNAINVISNAVGSKFVWNVAPLYTYREFEGEAPEASGVLKVIDGASFKGEVKEVEGMSTMTVPSLLYYEALGWTHSWLPIIIPGLFGGATTIFFLRSYMASISNETLEAAKLDGLGPFRIFIKIVLPQAVPAFVAQFIFSFVVSYNNYMSPLLYLSDNPKNYTLQLVVTELRAFYSQPNQICASCLVALIPLIVVYIIFQRFFIEGIAVGGGKE